MENDIVRCPRCLGYGYEQTDMLQVSDCSLCHGQKELPREYTTYESITKGE